MEIHLCVVEFLEPFVFRKIVPIKVYL